MPLTEQEKQEIRTNIKQLDCMNGTGVLSKNKKSMVKELFLIISSGGVGTKALVELKKMIHRELNEKEAERQIQFIAIDTNYYTFDNLVMDGALKEEEILEVPYESAPMAIDPNKMNETTRKWVHPGLYEQTRFRAGYFCGCGASAMRQCGRLMFIQPQTQERLFQKLLAIKSKVSAMKTEGAEDLKIKVIFLAGIAGGTGSGTIVDLGFLTRFYLNEILEGMENRITYSAYIFLPSASGTIQDKLGAAFGSRNAYAALKEIDYFMNLRSLNESFEMDYGTPQTRHVVMKDNLFDSCTLVEGVGHGGVFFGDPAGTARKITALSILNLLCDTGDPAIRQAYGYRGRRSLADEFLSGGLSTRCMISAHPDRNWPRESNYIYNVFDYAACVVPLDLLTLYAFKKVFDEVYADFSKHRNAAPDEAEYFLGMCGLDFRNVERNFRTMTPNTVRGSLEQACGTVFRQKGPYYMTSLIWRVIELIADPAGGYLARCQERQGRFLTVREKWDYISNLYKFLQKDLTNVSIDLYETYTFVIEEMKRFLEGNVGILTELAELKNMFGYSFYWSPIDLTKGTSAENKAVALFLDNLMNPQRTMQLARQFVDRMYGQKDRWTSLAPKYGHGTISFDAAGEIRSFIRSQMGDLACKTLEDYIVIAYSGDPGAHPSTMVNGREVPSNATKLAARNILQGLKTQAVPLASVRGEFSLEECYKNVNLTVPQECEYLYEAIVEQAEAYGIRKDNVFMSSSNDRITWSCLYSGLPAWALAWTDTAEEDYESGGGPSAVGLHMEQGPGGRNWAELPNLYPEGLWTPEERIIRGREAGISEKVRKAMEEAKAKGILIPDRPLNSIIHFEDGETSDSLWSAAAPLLEEDRKYALAEIYKMLEKQGKARKHTVECIGFMAEDDYRKDKEQLAFDMSCRVVRKNIKERKALERSLEIAEALDEKLRDRNM